MLVTAEDERALMRDVLAALGATLEEQTCVAEALTEGDLRGYASHGLLRFPLMVHRVRAGTARVGVEPRVVRRKAATALLDGELGLGPFVATRAVDLAITIARDQGLAAVGVYNNNHISQAGWYVERAAGAGLVGLATTSGDAGVHPFGGIDRLFGTNPLAIAIPTDDEPFLLDMATSEGTFGRIFGAKQRGEPIPPSWAVDEAGDPTTDANKALGGSLRPFGGVKGYGLGLSLAILAGGLLRAATGPGVIGTIHAADPTTKGDLFVALDPRAFGSGSAVQELASEFLGLVRGSRGVRESDAIRTPGERSLRLRRERLATGIPMDETTWGAVQALAREVGAR